VRADNSGHIIAAARRRADDARRRAAAALRRMDASGQPVTFSTVAAAAGVSRSWLYAQADLRGQIERLRTRQQQAPAAPQVPDRQRATPASLLRRLEAATARIRALESENRQLRDALEHALGEQRAAAILTSAATRPENTPQKEHPMRSGHDRKPREQHCL
jgi:small-conductance mechanosensitive channel